MNYAIEGYWRNWEWNTGWLAREINFEAIRGNPNIKKSDKPRNKKQYMKLSIDKEVDDKPTSEEVTNAENNI